MFFKMSLRDRLVCFAEFVGMTVLACLTSMVAFPFLLPLPNCFLSLSSHTYRGCLSTINNLCNLWHNKFKQGSTQTFCSWDDQFTQKWICGSPDNLCKCTESPSTLLTNTSEKWNLQLSLSNLLVTSFRLEMNTGGFPKHQSKTSDSDRNKVFFHRPCQVHVKTLKNLFEHWFELSVTIGLMVHVLSSSYNVPSFWLLGEGKATHHRILCVTNNTVLIRASVYHERVYANNIVCKFCFMRSFFSQHQSNFMANIPKV